jgi:hypothetical protein
MATEGHGYMHTSSIIGLVIHNVRWDILNGRWTHWPAFKKYQLMQNIKPMKRS